MDKNYQVINVMKYDLNSFWMEHEIRWDDNVIVRGEDNPKHPHHYKYQKRVNRIAALVMFFIFPLFWLCTTFGWNFQLLMAVMVISFACLVVVAGAVIFCFMLEIFDHLSKDVRNYFRGEI